MDLIQVITDLQAQLGVCPRCEKAEKLEADIHFGEVTIAVATCIDHNYGRVLKMRGAALAAMG